MITEEWMCTDGVRVEEQQQKLAVGHPGGVRRM
jgi:hypothetical protein